MRPLSRRRRNGRRLGDGGTADRLDGRAPRGTPPREAKEEECASPPQRDNEEPASPKRDSEEPVSAKGDSEEPVSPKRDRAKADASAKADAVTEKRVTVILYGSDRNLWSGGPLQIRVHDLFASGGPRLLSSGKTDASTIELRLQLPFDAGHHPVRISERTTTPRADSQARLPPREWSFQNSRYHGIGIGRRPSDRRTPPSQAPSPLDRLPAGRRRG